MTALFAGKLPCETLRDALCHRPLFEWSGRLRCTDPTRGMAVLARLGRREGSTRAARLERRRGGDRNARRASSRSATCNGAELDPDVFLSILQRQAHIESLISRLSRVTREGVRAQRFIVLVDARVVLGVVSRGRWSSRKLTTSRWNWSGSDVGQSSRCPIARQTDSKLARIVAEGFRGGSAL